MWAVLPCLFEGKAPHLYSTSRQQCLGGPNEESSQILSGMRRPCKHLPTCRETEVHHQCKFLLGNEAAFINGYNDVIQTAHQTMVCANLGLKQIACTCFLCSYNSALQSPPEVKQLSELRNHNVCLHTAKYFANILPTSISCLPATCKWVFLSGYATLGLCFLHHDWDNPGIKPKNNFTPSWPARVDFLN